MREVGYSLLESMVVLAIISVLAIAATADVFSNQESQRVEQGLRSLYSLSQAARQSAITEAREVVVEQSPHGWRIRDGAIAHAVQAEFRGFRSSRVRFYPNGSSDNGSWTLCIPPYQHPRALVLSKTGRARVTQYTDGDGLDERANGKPIECH